MVAEAYRPDPPSPTGVNFFLIDSFNNYTQGQGQDKSWRHSNIPSINMTVDLDTDPTYEDTTEQAVLVVLPLNALIPDQMERRKSLKSGKK